MSNNRFHILCMIAWSSLLFSCASTRNFSTNYYYLHEKGLTDIEQSYKTLYEQKPFSVGFSDRSFNEISLEIITDSIKLIYEFGIREPRLQDTLNRYGLPATAVTELINQMRAIRCIWINMLDYFSNNQKRSLVYLSIKPAAFTLPFMIEKYYILTFYSQPQYFDSEGRLLATRRQRKLRKINEDVFHRINDKVCYTVSERFR